MALRVGLAGSQGHVGVVLKSVCRLEDVELVAVADEDEQRALACRGWDGAHDARTYSDYREMLAAEGLDIVAEAGRDNQRAEVVQDALRAGAAVLCEKPLAMDLEQLAAVREAAEESGRLLSMLLTMRFEPAYRALQEVVQGGRIGEVCLATAQKSYRLGNRPAWQRSRATFSGIIPFIGIHALDLIRWTSGREFTEAMAYQANVAHAEMGDLEDTASVIARLDNGGSATVRLDYCRPESAPTHGDDRVRLAGSRGVAEALFGGQQVSLITEPGGVQAVDLPPAPDQFANFVAAVKGEAQCEVPMADCVRMTEIALKARESAETGQPVSL